jgi:hypothetical protein
VRDAIDGRRHDGPLDEETLTCALGQSTAGEFASAREAGRTDSACRAAVLMDNHAVLPDAAWGREAFALDSSVDVVPREFREARCR